MGLERSLANGVVTHSPFVFPAGGLAFWFSLNVFPERHVSGLQQGSREAAVPPIDAPCFAVQPGIFKCVYANLTFF